MQSLRFCGFDQKNNLSNEPGKERFKSILTPKQLKKNLKNMVPVADHVKCNKIIDGKYFTYRTVGREKDDKMFDPLQNAF